MTETTKPVQMQIENQIAVLTLNRPEALNALNDQVLDHLDNLLTELDCLVGDRQVAAVDAPLALPVATVNWSPGAVLVASIVPAGSSST